MVTICAVLCGADSWMAIEAFGKAQRKWFRSFLTLESCDAGGLGKPPGSGLTPGNAEVAVSRTLSVGGDGGWAYPDLVDNDTHACDGVGGTC